MAEHGILDRNATLSALPPVTVRDLRSRVQQDLASSSTQTPILVILDDDPTGTQTCHDVNILTVWDVPRLANEFKETKPGSGFFILTNSRAMHLKQARDVVVEICTNLKAASKETGLGFEVVLRCDSTLRGHFPLEPEAAESVLGAADAWVLCPFFLQGGRYTISDVHYVQEGDQLVPAAETPFAKDATFGYKSSNLRDYVVEKTRGAIPKERITSISLDMIRTGGVGTVLKQLLDDVNNIQQPVIVINAAADEDVDVVVAALLTASSAGKRFLFRTGAALVSSRLGMSSIPPISASQLNLRGDVGGLTIAGSYVPKTTAQLESLRNQCGEDLTSIELDVRKLLESPDDTSREIDNALATVEREIRRGQDVLVMTSREFIVGEDEMKSLDIGATIARVLVQVLQRLEQKPRYIIAKGGITSSDMATKGLRIRRARIVGQAAPGVPLWRCDEPGSKWPGLPYIVFPGNVGTDDTLYEVVRGWRV